jgi:transcriptional regulator with XRE-family HTH domain
MSRFEIAATLKRLRAKSKLTADEVGAILGKSGKTVNAWENGRGQPDADTLIALSDIYGVTDLLAEFSGKVNESIVLSDHEREVILAYRSHPDAQYHVDKLLDIAEKSIETKKHA